MNQSIPLQQFVGRKGKCVVEMFKGEESKWDWVNAEVVGVGSFMGKEPDQWFTWGNIQYPEGWEGDPTIDISIDDGGAYRLANTITPHKGGRTVSRRVDMTPATRDNLKDLGVSLGDLVQWAVDNYPKSEQ